MACSAVVLIEPERILSTQEALVINHVNQHVMFTEFYHLQPRHRWTHIHTRKLHVFLIYVGLTQARPNE